MNTWDKCKNCGGERGLHHYETMQCPVGGREAPIGRIQEWMTLTFETETADAAAELTAQAEEIARLRKIVEAVAELSTYSTIEIDFLKGKARAELERK